MPKCKILKRRSQFIRLSRFAYRFNQPGFILLLLEKQSQNFSNTLRSDKRVFIKKEDVSVGFTASKKIGNAVRRNRAKRLLRAIWRDVVLNNNQQSQKLLGYDCVLIAKSRIYQIHYKDLCQNLSFGLENITRRLKKSKYNLTLIQ